MKTMTPRIPDLDGITVIALEQAVAAPYASGLLAEAGARVIKVEREDGDFARHYDDMVLGHSTYFVWLNAGKESITLNLKDSDDAAFLSVLLQEADVFIQNLAPGALARLGFAPHELRKKHPHLIICSISGYGEDGPYRNQKAYDLLIQAETGLCSVTGLGEELTRVGVSVSDIAAGMKSCQEILQALFARERDPERAGRLINVSLFHATADWMNVPYLQHVYGGFTPGNHGLKHPSIAPYGAFICGDGKQVLLGIQNQREWSGLCTHVLYDPSIADDERFADNLLRVQNRESLDGLIESIFSHHSREEVVSRLEKANIAFGRVNDLNGLAEHPQNRYREIKTPNGTVRALGRGAAVEGKSDYPLSLPDKGQDNDRIRKEFQK